VLRAAAADGGGGAVTLFADPDVIGFLQLGVLAAGARQRTLRLLVLPLERPGF